MSQALVWALGMQHGRAAEHLKGKGASGPVTTQTKSQLGKCPCIWKSWHLQGRLRQMGDQEGLPEEVMRELTSEGWLGMAQQDGSGQKKQPELTVATTARDRAEKGPR